MAEPVILYKDGEEMTVHGRAQMQAMLDQGWREQAVASVLPDDFPARDALILAGLMTVEDVAAHNDLTTLEGIGKATATKIRAALP